MEWVAFAFRGSLEAVRAAGTTVARSVAVGGGTRSRGWLQILATVLEVPIDLPEAGDFGGAFGAARLAMAAADGISPALFEPPAILETIAPRRDLAGAYAAQFDRYHALYTATRPLIA
jgi:xylulokinase